MNDAFDIGVDATAGAPATPRKRSARVSGAAPPSERTGSP